MAKYAEWQQFGYQAYQFNRVADFGRPGDEVDPLTGVTSDGFEHIATLHYARRNQTITDRYQAAGTAYEDTLMIVIRHNRQLAKEPVVLVKIGNTTYQVINYSPNSSTYNSVDLLTLKDVKKVG